ncbi:hypothetical protein PBCV1_a688L [Paramecium bursaria Chlorella virus 1]|uniref:Uncharacterized protein n=1 Tax=Paramecium bursaria Chlorella virus 1 TaxID=10506 RepID=O41170_PBCV1|nr:hypothetical protein PBCV1_a688L [Paramecium bursaria Chlorella virus 1]AAC97057.2 hypothetical protein [Paramecium bursaria Chlorella virus 1]
MTNISKRFKKILISQRLVRQRRVIISIAISRNVICLVVSGHTDSKARLKSLSSILNGKISPHIKIKSITCS